MLDIRNRAFGPGGEYKLKDCIDARLHAELDRIFEVAGYDGSYTWYGEWRQDMRPVIKVFLLKGDSGILEWGWNYNFLPEYHSHRLQYYRTEKNARPQLRTFPGGFVAMKEWRQNLFPCCSSDRVLLLRMIDRAWKKTRPEIRAWYNRVNSFESMLEELNRQIEYGKYYDILYPEQEYIKAFLLAKTGRRQEALRSLARSRFWSEADENLREKTVRYLPDKKANAE